MVVELESTSNTYTRKWSEQFLNSMICSIMYLLILSEN